MLATFDVKNIAFMLIIGLTAFALEATPRTSRAQSMDVLVGASQCRRVKGGADVAHGRRFAGDCDRLGAVIGASDVRPAVIKEQIESFGEQFLDVPFITDEEKEIAQGAGGYARPVPMRRRRL